MNRRALLASISSGVAFSLAGCTSAQSGENTGNGGDVGTSPVADLEMTAVSDTEIARQVTYRIDLEHRTSERELAADVISNGSQTVTATNVPAPENRPFIYNESVYELSYEVLDAESATTFRLTLSTAESTGEDEESIRYQNLPTVDKEVLERFGWDDGGPFEVEGVETVYSDDEIAGSVLVASPEYEIIEWSDGTIARVTVEDSSGTEQHTYEYTSKQVHESAAEFGRSVREDHAFVLAELSEEQASIVSTAIEQDQGYRVDEGDPSEAFSQLVDLLARESEATPVYEDDDSDSSVSGSYIVRYDGEVYWTELFVSESDN
ncbi:hypothetical protein ACFR97_15710 [Haloplanus litoreus]|uniref:Halobacterial output domain-containing protein n=1 Tax=Haloplanus litoreus TaxID=767515 RepID=A0ABD6A4K9_9EURY